MKESIGYTVDINIVIIFIVIVFTFLSSALIYFKSNKIGNVITDSIEKYEGHNELAKVEIERYMSSLGYNKNNITCAESVNDENASGACVLTEDTGTRGYCVYRCIDKIDNKYYYYKIRTNMMINIPIINDLLNIPIYSNTNRLYDFENNFNFS